MSLKLCFLRVPHLEAIFKTILCDLIDASFYICFYTIALQASFVFFSKRDTMWLYCFDYNIFAWSVSKSPEGSCVLFQCYVNVAWVKGENGRFYGERVYRENKSWIKLIFLREMKWLQIKYRFFKNRRSCTFIAHSNLLRYPWKYF